MMVGLKGSDTLPNGSHWNLFGLLQRSSELRPTLFFGAKLFQTRAQVAHFLPRLGHDFFVKKAEHK
jgi:hypothetical protein